MSSRVSPPRTGPVTCKVIKAARQNWNVSYSRLTAESNSKISTTWRPRGAGTLPITHKSAQKWKSLWSTTTKQWEPRRSRPCSPLWKSEKSTGSRSNIQASLQDLLSIWGSRPLTRWTLAITSSRVQADLGQSRRSKHLSTRNKSSSWARSECRRKSPRNKRKDPRWTNWSRATRAP